MKNLVNVTEKKIFDVKYKKNSKNVFTMTIIAEGGLPIKRFIVGDDVLPNISTLFDTPMRDSRI